MEGFLLVDKPEGISSHGAIQALRRTLSIKRIGHAGTLDPFASGLLLIGISRAATKHLGAFVGLDKRYTSTFILGGHSTTDDRLGERTFTDHSIHLTHETITQKLPEFTGTISQIPPTFSAIQIGGKRLYKEARAGRPITPPARQTTIFHYACVSGPSPAPDVAPTAYRIEVEVHCASGTYIRALARDLGASLGIGGYAESLRRTTIGPFSLKNALPVVSFTKETIQQHLLPIESTVALRAAYQKPL